MKVEWLQVPEDVILTRSRNLAGLLSEATGKRVTHGEALLFILKTWMWVVDQVEEDNPDIASEFERAAVLDRLKAETLLAQALEWPAKHKAALVDALADSSVRVLEPLDGLVVRVRDVEERYKALAKKQAESRGRARVSRAAREAGWEAEKGGQWRHPADGRHVASWRELEALLRTQGLL